jgi:type II secretory pathway component PulF
MSKRLQARLSALLLSLTLLFWFALALLIFYVPKLEKLWEDTNQAISTAQRILLDTAAWLGGHASNDQTIPGVVIIFIPLVALTFSSIIWRIKAPMASHQHEAKPAVRG